MSKFKRLAAVLLSVAMLVCCFSVSASAESIADTAKAISSGESKTLKYSKNEDINNDFCIKLSQKGNIVISIASNVSEIYVYIFDENGNKYVPDTTSATSGSVRVNSYGGYAICDWNSTVEKCRGTMTYKNMKKGTYYVRFRKEMVLFGGGRTGKATIKITYPSSDAESTSKLTSITIPMKVGDTMQLSTDAGSTGVTWTSSKASVAAISSAGKVTAKAKGTTMITAKIGSSTAKLVIQVS